MKEKLQFSAIVFFLSAVSLFYLSCAEEPPKVKLEMKFNEGRELVYEQTNKQSVKVDTGAAALETNSSHGEMIQKVAQLLADARRGFRKQQPGAGARSTGTA